MKSLQGARATVPPLSFLILFAARIYDGFTQGRRKNFVDVA